MVGSVGSVNINRPHFPSQLNITEAYHRVKRLCVSVHNGVNKYTCWGSGAPTYTNRVHSTTTVSPFTKFVNLANLSWSNHNFSVNRRSHVTLKKTFFLSVWPQLLKSLYTYPTPQDNLAKTNHACMRKPGYLLNIVESVKPGTKSGLLSCSVTCITCFYQTKYISYIPYICLHNQ